jgi:GNAT superfamily N-acetyltransferase
MVAFPRRLERTAYRLLAPDVQDAQTIVKQLLSGELWGRPPRYGGSAQAKAYRGQIPMNGKGFEFWSFGLPRAFGLWAAVDDAGVVRATSGSATFEAMASVIFINTDPDWRRRGIARAMTAIAPRAAQQAGARHAGIDASDAGRELYLRLGFEDATVVTRFRSSP